MNNIQNLWYGNLKPATEPGINDRTASNISGHIDDKIEKLRENLNEEGKARLSRLIDDYSEQRVCQGLFPRSEVDCRSIMHYLRRKRIAKNGSPSRFLLFRQSRTPVPTSLHVI